MSHTKGKVSVSGLGWSILDETGKDLANCGVGGRDSDEADANARRLVACWNRLAPFSTEDIEQGMDWMKLVQEHEEVIKERDELLAALRISTRGLRHCSRWNISEEKEKALMTQVIANETLLAKYKEEA